MQPCQRPGRLCAWSLCCRVCCDAQLTSEASAPSKVVSRAGGGTLERPDSSSYGGDRAAVPHARRCSQRGADGKACSRSSVAGGFFLPLCSVGEQCSSLLLTLSSHLQAPRRTRHTRSQRTAAHARISVRPAAPEAVGRTKGKRGSALPQRQLDSLWLAPLGCRVDTRGKGVEKARGGVQGGGAVDRQGVVRVQHSLGHLPSGEPPLQPALSPPPHSTCAALLLPRSQAVVAGVEPSESGVSCRRLPPHA